MTKQGFLEFHGQVTHVNQEGLFFVLWTIMLKCWRRSVTLCVAVEFTCYRAIASAWVCRRMTSHVG